MNNKIINIGLGLLVIVSTVNSLIGQTVKKSPNVLTNKNSYWEMEGHLVTFPISDSDSLSGNEIFELKNDEGLTKWFGRDIRQEVCLTGQCKLAHLWIFWDCRGNYLGFELHDNNPLTKGEKELPFNEEDYMQLDRILSDSVSILKDLDLKDLTIKDNNELDSRKIDGVTSATNPTLSSAVISGAVYTCYTLWHTVYGSTRVEVKKLLNERIDNEYFKLLFNQKALAYQLLAVDLLNESPQYLKDFLPEILKLFRSSENSFSSPIIKLFNISPEILNDTLQQTLVMGMPEYSNYEKYHVFKLLERIPRLEDKTIQILLEEFNNEKLGTNDLNKIYNLITSSHLKNRDILSIVKKNLKNTNLYIQNLSKKLLLENGAKISE